MRQNNDVRSDEDMSHHHSVGGVNEASLDHKESGSKNNIIRVLDFDNLSSLDQKDKSDFDKSFKYCVFGKTYQIEGKSFTTRNLRRVILYSEKDYPFSISHFFRSFRDHFSLLFLGPFVGNFLPILFNKFNRNYLLNLEFLGLRNKSFLFDTMISLSTMGTHVFAALLSKEETMQGFEFQWKELAHFWLTILIRIVTVSVKYGYYSLEHMKIIDSIVMEKDLKNFDLVVNANDDRDTRKLYERMEIILEHLQLSRHQFYFMIDEDELETRQHLTSMINFFAHYEIEQHETVKEPDSNCFQCDMNEIEEN